MSSQVSRIAAMYRVSGVALAAAALFAVAAIPHAQAPQTVQDGVYTEAQAARGRTTYVNRCASCHGEALTGAQAPPLTGHAFLGNWRSQQDPEHDALGCSG